MNSLCDQLLSCPAFSCNQDSGTRRSHLFNEPENLLHNVGAADDLATIHCLAHGPAQSAAFFFFAPALDTGGNGGSDLFVLKWLSNTPESASLPGGNRGVKRSVGSYHYNHCLGVHLQEFFQGSETTDSRH